MTHIDPNNIAIYDAVTAMSLIPMPYRLNKVLVVVCEKGSLQIELDTRSLRMKERQLMVLIPDTMVMSYRPSDDFEGYALVTPISRLNPDVTSIPQVMRCFLHFRSNPLVELQPDEIATQVQLRAILKRHLEEAESPQADGHPFVGNIIQALLQSIFYETLSIYTRRMNTRQPDETSRRAEIFHEFTTAVSRDFRTCRTVSHYASQLCITPKHLSNVVKELSGLSPLQWINTYVILEAKKMLDTTDLTVQQIASHLNFPNQSFFGKFFKKRTGLSPRAYRSPAR